MREIEIKVRVADKTKLLETLRSKSIEMSELVTQRDRVFGLPHEKGGEGKSLPWLRIRSETKNGQTRQIFTFKKSVTNQMDSIEHETEVTSQTELESIILQLGFTPYSDLTKTRMTAHVGEIELCIDTVAGLGDFIEAEKLTDEDVDYEKVAEELWKILEDFELSRADHVTDGYDVLQRKMQHLDV
jgi:adenylate cyclase class 2